MMSWQSQMPSDWTVKRLKHVASLQSGDGITSESIEDSGAHPVYGGNGLRGYTDSFTHDGDFVLIGRQGALCGNVHLVNGQFWASEHAVVATFYAGDNPRWARYVFEHMNLGQYSVASAQPGLAVDRIKELSIPVPPTSVQKAIASYLDAETRRIDVLIGAKSTLLDAVREMQVTLGFELATQGLDSHAECRASGIEWIPAIPSHWVVKRNMFLFRERNEDGVDDLPILKVSLHTGVSEGDDAEEAGSARVRKQMEDKTSYKLTRRGDIAYNMMRAWQGAIGAVPADGLVSPAYVVLKPEEGLDPRYFELLARTAGYKKDFERYSYGIASFRWRLYWEGFKEILTPVPPLEEQRAIVAAYDPKYKEMAALLEHVEREIELLVQLRATTITDAVLGRIDVLASAKN